MKKITLFFFMLCALSFSWQSNAQVTVGTGTYNNAFNTYPFNPYYGYSYAQSIYLASEINATGDITAITFEMVDSDAIPNSDDQIDLWIGHTTKTTFASTSDWVDVTTLTQVMTNGTLTKSGTTITFTFSTPFTYNGTDNLIIALDANEASFDTSADKLYGTNVSVNRTLRQMSDSVNLDPLAPITGTLTTYIGNATFLGITQTCPAPTGLTATNITAYTADLGWTAGGGETLWDIELVNVTAAGTPTGTPTVTGVGNPYVQSGLTADNDYEFYVRADCGGGDYSAWVGPFSFATAILCPAPTALTVTNITTASANLGWTAGGGEALWDIELVDITAAGTPTGTPTATGVGNPYSQGGLSSENDYQFYVRADCGGSDGVSSWAGPFSFTTLCTAITPDYNADMSTNVPDCWLEANNGDATTGPTELGSGLWFASNHGGTPSNVINLYAATRSDWIISPIFDLSAAAPSELNVYVALTESTTSGSGASLGSDDEVQLLMTIDGGTTWTTMQSWVQGTEPTDVGEEITYDLTAITGTVQFAFLGSEGSINDPEDVYFHVSKFQVRETPSCEPPSALTVTNITTASANLGWTAGGGEALWDIELVDITAAGTPTGTPTATGVGNPYTQGGLADANNYEFYVRADCGGGDTSVWIGPMPFYTGHCIPSGTSSSTYINNFSTTNGAVNISNLASGFTTGNYQNNFSTMSVSGAPDDTFDFNVEIVSGTVGCALWVDWNSDLEFTTDEVVFSTTIYGNGPFTGTVTIPTSTPDGDYRMRVMIDWNDSNPGNDAACSFGSGRGEVEDYKVTVNGSLSVGETNFQSFSYFPNPVKNTLTLNAQREIQNVIIYNILGQEALNISPNSLNEEIDMSVLKSGAYFVKVTIDNNTNVIRVIKE